MIASKTYELLSLISDCLPEDQELKRYVLFAQLVGLPEYIELSKTQNYQSLFAKHFAPGVLVCLNVAELEDMFHVIRILPSVLSELIISIRTGCGSRLTSSDKPDFYNADQLSDLLSKLKNDSEGTNYSNIKESEFIMLFDDKVVRSADAVFMSLPSGHKFESADAISKALPDIKFCISQDAFLLLINKTDELIAAHKDIKNKQKTARVSRLLLKIGLILLFLAIPYVLIVFGSLSIEWFIKAEIAVFTVSIIYLLLGLKNEAKQHE